jgi:hypothetical protein
MVSKKHRLNNYKNRKKPSRKTTKLHGMLNKNPLLMEARALLRASLKTAPFNKLLEEPVGLRDNTRTRQAVFSHFDHL